MTSHDIIRSAEVPWKMIEAITDSGGVICGGFARHLASSNLDSTAKDIDIYPINEESLTICIKTLLELQERTGHGTWTDHPKDYNGVKTQKVYITEDGKTHIVQIVHMTKSPEEILETFDFTVCQAYLDFHARKIITPVYWKDHEDGRYLRLANNDRKFLGYRMIKYIEKGYMPDYKTIVEFMSRMEISETPEDVVESHLANWLGHVHNSLNCEDDNLANQISVLGQLIESSSFNHVKQHSTKKTLLSA